MLCELHIENYAIIDKLIINFAEGLNVITGETGAGKSLLVGALKLLLGERGGVDRIGPRRDELIVSARFLSANEKADFDGDKFDEIVIERRITKAGRSYFWINGRPATAEMVKNIGRFLVDIHGQHSHQLLFDPSYHLDILDEFADVYSLRDAVRKKFDVWNDLVGKLNEIENKRDEILRQQRLVKFELEELNAAELEDIDEEKKLEEKLEILESTERILEFAQNLSEKVYEGDGSIVEIAGELRNRAKSLPIMKNLDKVVEYLDTIIAASEEISSISNELARVEYDPELAESIRERLSFLGDLQRKYHKSLSELVQYRKELEKISFESENVDEEIEKLKNEIAETVRELNEKASELSHKRLGAGKKLQSKVRAELKSLGFDNAEFSVKFERIPDDTSPFSLGDEPVKLTARGFERVEFLFSANPGHPVQPLRKIASGGELSRLALAVKVVLPSSNVAGCSLFDEIDAGIGGQTAIKVAERLAKLAESKQVIVISHLHPIARRANHHIALEKIVSKQKTKVLAKILTGKDREDEIIRMMAIEKQEVL